MTPGSTLKDFITFLHICRREGRMGSPKSFAQVIGVKPALPQAQHSSIAVTSLSLKGLSRDYD
jgi:hypothetical protein